MKEKGVYRLAKPMKKGLLRLLFSRFLIILLLMVLQIGLLVAMYLFLDQYLSHFAIAMLIFTAAMIIYLFNCPMDVDGKLTWMFIISVAPVGGAILLAFTQSNAGHRRTKRRVTELIQATRAAIPQPEGVLEELERDDQGTEDLVHYLNRSGCFPAFQNTETEYFSGGESMYKAILREIDKAEKFIFLEFFILEEGYMWGGVLEKLTEKAAKGVDVRVIYDGMCEINRLPMGYYKLLRSHGIQAKAFAPIRPMVSSHYNYRDHRKILVVDGRVAFTGGVNLADEYINRIELFGRWKDAGLLVQGPAASSFTLMFLQNWNIDEKEAEFPPELLTLPKDSPAAEGTVIPYADSPLDRERVGERVYLDILNRANDYVHIMTPYLILDCEMENALCYAAERGVDVKLILPGIPDKKLAYALAKSHYRDLVAAGVEIYEYTPGFVHAKVAVSDDIKAVVGTINLDYRSLYHHFECAAYLYQTPSVADAEADFERTLRKCRRVTEETMKKEKLFYRVMGPLIKFLAPLM